MAIEIKMPPSHPGSVIRELILPPEMTITDVAKKLDVSRQTMDALVNERRSITPEMALKIETVFGGKAFMLLKLQARYDLYRAQKNAPVIIKGLVPHETHPSMKRSA